MSFIVSEHISKENRICDTADQIKEIIEKLEAQAASLEYLELSGISVSTEVAAAFKTVILKMDALQRVNFRDMFVGRKKDTLNESVRLLMEGLEGKNIVSLDLSENAFGPAGVEAVSKVLLEMKGLKILEIENNGLGPVES